MEWLEVAAPSLETAKELALDRLGVHESDVEIEIITEGKLGLFGRVKEEARIRVRIMPTPVRSKSRRSRSSSRGKRGTISNAVNTTTGSASTTGVSSTVATHNAVAHPDTQPDTETAESTEKFAGNLRDAKQQASLDMKAASDMPKKILDKQNPGKTDKTGSPGKTGNSGSPGKSENLGKTDKTGTPFAQVSCDKQADIAEAFVSGLAEVMNVNLTFTREFIDDDVMNIEAVGEDIGILVGSQGSTARAVDQLARTVIQRKMLGRKEGRIRMDIGGLHALRSKALADFIKSIAEDVCETGEEIQLEPMNRLDRKIVHDVVAEIDGVASASEGRAPMKQITIKTV